MCRHKCTYAYKSFSAFIYMYFYTRERAEVFSPTTPPPNPDLERIKTNVLFRSGSGQKSFQNQVVVTCLRLYWVSRITSNNERPLDLTHQKMHLIQSVCVCVRGQLQRKRKNHQLEIEHGSLSMPLTLQLTPYCHCLQSGIKTGDILNLRASSIYLQESILIKIEPSNPVQQQFSVTFRPNFFFGSNERFTKVTVYFIVHFMYNCLHILSRTFDENPILLSMHSVR